MNNREKRLEKILNVQSWTGQTADMAAYIVTELEKIGGVSWYTDNGNIYASRGETEKFPCIVAHTDTVHGYEKGFEVFKLAQRSATCPATLQYGPEIEFPIFIGRNAESLQAGTGGDDKIGVWIALEMIRRFSDIKVAFFRDEESGCVGSAVADLSFFDDVGYILQSDRQGSTDFVRDIYMELYGEEFSKEIAPILKKHGYSECFNGGLTDVAELADNLDICVANASSGYHFPHTSGEIVSIPQAMNCLNMFISIVGKLGSKEYPFSHVPSWGGQVPMAASNSTYMKCEECGQYHLCKWSDVEFSYICQYCETDFLYGTKQRPKTTDGKKPYTKFVRWSESMDAPSDLNLEKPIDCICCGELFTPVDLYKFVWWEHKTNSWDWFVACADCCEYLDRNKDNYNLMNMGRYNIEDKK